MTKKPVCDVIRCDVTKTKFENSNGQVLQFYVHCISAKYHSFRLHTYEEETFGSFDFLIGHYRVT